MQLCDIASQNCQSNLQHHDYGVPLSARESFTVVCSATKRQAYHDSISRMALAAIDLTGQIQLAVCVRPDGPALPDLQPQWSVERCGVNNRRIRQGQTRHRARDSPASMIT